MGCHSLEGREEVGLKCGAPATDTQDQIVKLSGKAPFRIPANLEPGQWRIALIVEGDTPYRKTISLHVPEAR